MSDEIIIPSVSEEPEENDTELEPVSEPTDSLSIQNYISELSSEVLRTSEDNVSKPILDVNERDNFPATASIRDKRGRLMKNKDLKQKVGSEKWGLHDKTHPRVLQARERADEIFQLRKSGWTLRELALKYDVHVGAISAILKRETNRVTKVSRETLEDMRQLQLERLDFMLKCLWPAMEHGVANAIEKGLAVMERQAKLMGLDAPEKKEINITVEMSDEELIRNAINAGIEIPKELDTGSGPIITADFTVKEVEKIEDEKTKKETDF